MQQLSHVQSVSTAFKVFNRDYVNIESAQTNTALSSRDALVNNLHRLSSNGNIPISYSDMDTFHGSFARKTKIRELDDIDMMICYKALGCTYNENGEIFDINVPYNTQVLIDLTFEDNNNLLNSRRVVSNIVQNLSGIEMYKIAESWRNGEAARLQLKSYPWNFDIVPCFYTTDDFYLIPDGNGHWKRTDPRIDQKRVTDANQIQNGKLLQLIRTMKYWKHRIWGNILESYAFEQMIISYAENFEMYSLQQNITNCLNYLSKAILYSIPDPKGIQGDLNSLSMDDRRKLCESATHHYNLANDAWVDEIFNQNQVRAINKWKLVFGNNFPSYNQPYSVNS